MKWLNRLLCALFGHVPLRRPDAGGIPVLLPESEPWPCISCGDPDCRPTWIIQMDTEDRLERIYLEIRRRQL